MEGCTKIRASFFYARCKKAWLKVKMITFEWKTTKQEYGDKNNHVY